MKNLTNQCYDELTKECENGKKLFVNGNPSNDSIFCQKKSNICDKLLDGHNILVKQTSNLEAKYSYLSETQNNSTGESNVNYGKF